MTAPARILIVDDDPIVADSLADFLRTEGYPCATAGDGVEAIQLIEDADHRGNGSRFGLVLADMNMPRAGGLDLLKSVRQTYPSLAVIMITGFGKIDDAVSVVRLGAADYLTKPLVDDELRVAVSKAMRQHVLLAENQNLRSTLAQRFGMDNLIGADHRMQKLYDLIEAVAETRTTVLITGESGTGKTVIARAVHTKSPRAAGPFVSFSCGAVPESLLESELFGHAKGAFTGADRDKPGKLQAAQGGTLLIDEINSATPALQLKLLRVLQERQYEPVGSNQTHDADVRFILATNQSLEALVEEGMFREDLYYRINVVNLAVPSLRQRIGDVPLLAEHFLEQHAKEVGKAITGFSKEAVQALQQHDWPGNVRELENAVERAVVLSRQPVIDVDDLPETVRGEAPQPRQSKGRDADASGALADPEHLRKQGLIRVPALAGGFSPMTLEEAMREPERQILLAALLANDWNRQETSKQLGINRTTLYKKIKQYQLDEPES